ncbi:MAG: hypothetical protein IPM51_07375 [Sphingobacteriaceae bacterium]|nr:hypothetical protein [Sphingobacteriaceae bacterium]
MNWQKLDSFWKGLAIGVFFPMLIFVLYWLFFHHQLSFPKGFLRYLTGGYLLSSVIKICGIGNLLLFYLGLTKKIDKFTKGIILSVLLYVLLVAYVSYFMEPEFI